MRKHLVHIITFIWRITVILSSLSCDAQTQDKVRPAANAGAFYPADPKELAGMIDSYLAKTRVPEVNGIVYGVVAPHAGYVYSGPVAAYSYSLLKNKKYTRVIVISPSHVAAFQGSAVYDGKAYATPLGEIEVDQPFCKKLSEQKKSIRLSAEGHETRYQGRMEHALEVQLPFLQRVLGKFKLVPVVMGDQSYENCRDLGRALAQLCDDQTIMIASSDLSHFHGYDEAKQLDSKVLRAIEDWDYFNLCRNLRMDRWEACGGGPITAVMIAAEQLGANTAKVIKYANSGDVPAGEKDRVVGYGSVALYKDPGLETSSGFGFSLTAEEKKYLLNLAKKSVDTAVRKGKMLECSDGGYSDLALDRGAFVTLTIGGQLRGCIGYTSPFQSLYLTVRDVAHHAALKDPRFPAVSEKELPRLEYEISVLSPLRRVTGTERIKIGTHGLIIKKGPYEGLLLPQVATDYNWDTVTFLEQTCHKAGLPADAWKDPDTDIFYFSALVFGED
jgi:MEMO1 family protein